MEILEAKIRGDVLVVSHDMKWAFSGKSTMYLCGIKVPKAQQRKEETTQTLQAKFEHMGEQLRERKNVAFYPRRVKKIGTIKVKPWYNH